jgi:hypothetical protein
MLNSKRFVSTKKIEKFNNQSTKKSLKKFKKIKEKLK